MSPRRLGLLLSFMLSCTGIAAAQVPSPAPAAGATNSEPRAFALRSLNDGSAGADTADIAAYRKALRLAPNDAGLYNNLGYAYARQQNYEAAISMLQQAIKLDPNLAAAHYNLGMVYDHLGQLPLALRATRQAVAADPQHIRARAHLCELHLALAQAAEAVGLL